MMDTHQLLWFSLCFLFLFLEMGHPGLFYFISFSCGAFCSYIATFYTDIISYQLTIFLGATTCALYLVHLFIHKKYDQLPSQSHRSNNDALVGKHVVVYQDLHDKQVWITKIYGQVWVVKNIHDDSFVVGQHAIIRDVQGCHLRVEKISVSN